MERFPPVPNTRRTLFTQAIPALVLLTTTAVWLSVRPTDEHIKEAHEKKNRELLEHFDRGGELYYRLEIPIIKKTNADIILLEHRGSVGEEKYVVKLTNFPNYQPLPLESFELRK